MLKHLTRDMYDDRETEHHNNEVNIDDISYTETINYTDKYLPKTKRHSTAAGRKKLRKT